MRRLYPLLFLLLAIPAWNCSRENACDCFKGTGEVIEENRQLPVFHTVYVEDNVNLIFTEDTVQQVTVEAGKHLVKLIKTEMNGDQLEIRNKNTCNFVRRYDIPVNVHIHYLRNQVYRIRTKGTGVITNTNPCTSDSIDLNGESSGDFEFNVAGNGVIFTHQHGAGDVTLHGSAGQIIIYSKGTGFTITDDCTNYYTWIYTNTTGRITVDPSQTLIANIDGSGNVYYKGTPAIQQNSTSTGKVLPLQ